MHRHIFAFFCILIFGGRLFAEIPPELRIGRANHAFDHLGGIGDQAEAAAASGATIIYTSGLGEAGYHGLPTPHDFQALREHVTTYNRRAKEHGIELVIGYLCATSIVKLDTFDKNWTDEFRAQFKTRPAEWRQQDRHGKPLPSWYGGDYQPACMNNPDWRAYERAMVRYQLASGSDGVFFDNPTVHPHGCYCSHCMKPFAKFFVQNAAKPVGPETTDNLEAIRSLADSHPDLFLRFRATIARDFLAHIREYARTINPRALITCNNSLNSPSVFFSQNRMYGYDIEEMSKVEDFIVVEDMATQPRTEANGETIEYGPTYKMLHAISHNKPVIAVTVANADYHTPANLVRLAMAEAAANNASYLSWPTWPENQRERMIAAVRPQSEFLKRNEELLNDAPCRADVVVLLPFNQWVRTDKCAVSEIAATLTKENIQYSVISADDLERYATQDRRPLLIAESRTVFATRDSQILKKLENTPGIITKDRPDWLKQVRQTIGHALTIAGPPSVRAVVHEQTGRIIVHLYNLNVQRLSSLEDKVTPATDLKVAVRVPFEVIRDVWLDTADDNEKRRSLPFKEASDGAESVVRFEVPRLAISAIVVIERKED